MGMSLLFLAGLIGCSPVRQVPVAEGWANNSVNVAVFRKNSLVSHGDTQFVAYYDPEGFLTLGKRHLKARTWTLQRTRYRGKVTDAHNVISLMIDGAGRVHVAWDHHGNPLRYARGIAPGSLELGEREAMIGTNEGNVTYPEFFRMPDGNLLFMYRDGTSGNGNLVMNRYEVTSGQWARLHANLIDGEGERNAYWQACVDPRGVIHLSWVWRETWDVSTNHDLCYARSRDGGMTWENSRGESFSLPIRAATAEYAYHIPQNSELINQTSMCADARGIPYIATYWRDEQARVPQYRVVWLDDGTWRMNDLGFRTRPFSLKGGGTKRLPVSRPQIVAGKSLWLVFRDEERGERVAVARCDDLRENRWRVEDLTLFPVGSWEPTYDTELWREKGGLHLFVQRVEQVDGEGRTDGPPQMIYIVETKYPRR
ncbi:MAG: BNR repeat-containing protein [Odoribacteraceae bacterium]|nr:BNR repeat-containing protein [Odoribacteraceae bacterium]